MDALVALGQAAIAIEDPVERFLACNKARDAIATSVTCVIDQAAFRQKTKLLGRLQLGGLATGVGGMLGYYGYVGLSGAAFPLMVELIACSGILAATLGSGVMMYKEVKLQRRMEQDARAAFDAAAPGLRARLNAECRHLEADLTLQEVARSPFAGQALDLSDDLRARFAKAAMATVLETKGAVAISGILPAATVTPAKMTPAIRRDDHVASAVPAVVVVPSVPQEKLSDVILRRDRLDDEVMALRKRRGGDRDALRAKEEKLAQLNEVATARTKEQLLATLGMADQRTKAPRRISGSLGDAISK